MANLIFPIEHIRLVGTITLWGWYDACVYEVDEVSTESQFNSFISGANTYGYGSALTDITPRLLSGTPAKDVVETANLFKTTQAGPETSGFVAASSEILKYGPTSQSDITRLVEYYKDIDYGVVTRVRYIPKNYGTEIIQSNREKNVYGVDRGLWESFNSGDGGFVRVKIGNDYKYFRAYIRVYFSHIETAEDPVARLYHNTSAGGRADDFYGCKTSTLLNLSDIGNGTAVFTEDPDYKPPGPLDPIDPSAPGNLPPGTFDDSSDPIPDSSLPTISAANTGFTRIYNPSLAQVQDLARYLWTDETVIDTIWNKIRQFFENPMDAIIGFNLVPVAVPNGGTKNFALMYIDTGVQMTAAANQFVDQDCGTVKVERYYGSALDQSPYTKVSCFLPYIGTVQLNTDEVMGTTLQVKYRVDIVSGSCVAKIFVDGNVLYQYSGHCAITIPFASADFSNYVSSAISVAKLAIGAAAGGVAGAVTAVAGDAQQQTNQVVTITRTTTDTVRNPATGRQTVSGTRSTVETVERPSSTSTTQASFDGISPANISNTVGQIMGSKPNVEHSGSFSGNTGYLGVRRPFIIIERPNMCLPESYQTMNGYPAMITMELGSCKGYTRVQQVQLTEMSATNPEQAEILTLLKSGVIL